ncbi:MAG: HD domain-containing phosphohydrolase [Endomicrobiales bacterium]
MRKDYRKDLEKAAHQMILVHRVDTLARLIVRTILRNLRVKHAGIFIYDKQKAEYIVRVSKGERGIKIPAGFTKIRSDNPLIRYFTDGSFKIFKQDYLLYNRIHYYLNSPRFKENREAVDFLHDLKDELSLYQAKALVPGFFRNNLVGVLFLGSKEDRSSFSPEELGFLSVLASDVVMALQNAWLFEDLSGQLIINKQLFLNTVTSLATAIEAKDKYTIGHTARVVNYSLEIARNLAGIKIGAGKDFEENLRIAALLHDIGKIGVPEEVLNKNGPLSEQEREQVIRHPQLGVDILNHIHEFKEVILGVKYHHERYDGTGYPFRLSGEAIPLAASIIAVADAFDAMTSDRPYRRAFPEEQAMQEIRANSGKQFHPAIVEAFLRSRVKPPASEG